MQIIQNIAQLESEQISERVSIALKQKITKSTEFMGHNPPYGYKSGKKKGSLIPIEEELDIVKKCYDLYNEGYSYREIEKMVKRPNTSIRHYLQNPCYAGYERWFRWIRRATYYKKIIPIQTWNKTQNLIRSRARKQSKRIMIQLKDVDYFEIPKVKAIKMSKTGVNRPKQKPL